MTRNTDKSSAKQPQLRAIELFAGVGGFRLGLEASGWEVVWANQWEPPGTPARQFAYDCYVERFDSANLHPEAHSNRDIAAVLDDVKAGEYEIPEHELLVGGFPCQDYSVAKPLSQAEGIRGKKGVLWWEIYRLLEMKEPKYVLLENVDRLLKSPVKQRGRDFAIILACLAHLGYGVEWRVVNAAEYGYPQRRRRVFIYAEKLPKHIEWDPAERLVASGVLARALPVAEREHFEVDHASIITDYLELPPDVYEVSNTIGLERRTSPFKAAGIMTRGHVWTRALTPVTPKRLVTLGDVVKKTKKVDESFFLDEASFERWAYLKGAKSEPRVNRASGFEYRYSEGGMSFPDPLERPARTILTGEGGTSASRFKHVVQAADGKRLRRLTPDELEELNGFPRGWTNTGMSDVKRAFCMGNALVVGVVERIGEQIRADAVMLPTRT
ncbi:MAG: DNA (cytosine-5-)-methyltransferase [Actinobacteria bacterium]|nr:DNA (cytosine-5-)-methyltransferase [Actinomycetota bacterium]MCG2807787.1 DNA (cytosine-5-)-methyltransferase [Coriobacteriia bacterium]